MSRTTTSTRCASAASTPWCSGCTHYPLLTAVISYVMGDDVTLVSSAEETAKDVYRVLADADLLRPDDLPPPDHGFTTTGDPEEFRRLASRFLGVGSRLGPVFTSPPHPVTAALT